MLLAFAIVAIVAVKERFPGKKRRKLRDIFESERLGPTRKIDPVIRVNRKRRLSVYGNLKKNKLPKIKSLKKSHIVYVFVIRTFFGLRQVESICRDFLQTFMDFTVFHLPYI